jgi:hypothetical protein
MLYFDLNDYWKCRYDVGNVRGWITYLRAPCDAMHIPLNLVHVSFMVLTN